MPEPSDSDVHQEHLRRADVGLRCRDHHVGEDPVPPHLSEDELWDLHGQYERDPSPETKAVLVAAYMDFALTLAQRLRRSLEPIEDLRQVALEALLVALDRFDPSRGVPFKGFAKPTIEGALKRHYRDTGWAMRVPRRVHELAGPIRRATDRLTMELARRPTQKEVADALGVDPEQIDATRRAINARAVGSIDTPARPDGRAVEPPAQDRAFERADNHIALLQALCHLDGRERAVLRQYYAEDQTQSEIAEAFGVSQMQVSRWVSAATARLRRYMLDAESTTRDTTDASPSAVAGW